MDPFDFTAYAKDNGFAGLEYVSQLYNSAMEEYDSKDEAIKAITQRLKQESESAAMENLIIKSSMRLLRLSHVTLIR